MRNIGNRIGKSIRHAAGSGGVFNTLQQFMFNVQNLWNNDNGTIHLQGPPLRYNDLDLAPDTGSYPGPNKTPGNPYPAGPLGEDTPDGRYNWTYYKGNYSYTILERPQTFTISGGGVWIDYFIVAGGGSGGCSVKAPLNDYNNGPTIPKGGGGGGCAAAADRGPEAAGPVFAAAADRGVVVAGRVLDAAADRGRVAAGPV